MYILSRRGPHSDKSPRDQAFNARITLGLLCRVESPYSTFLTSEVSIKHQASSSVLRAPCSVRGKMMLWLVQETLSRSHTQVGL